MLLLDLPLEKTRILKRVDGVGVRPIFRNFDDVFSKWKTIYANHEFHNAFGGVAYVVLIEALEESPPEEKRVTIKPEGQDSQDISINGVTLDVFRAFIQDINANAEELSRHLRPETLEAARELAQKLEKN